MLLELHAIGFTNWCSRIRSALERTGLDQTLESQNIGDTNKFMLSFKESIVSNIYTAVEKRYCSSSKLRTYALVKKYFCVEPYILHIRGNHLITAMARYRMSSHDLDRERGRFNNPITPKIQQICTRCELSEIDNEIHRLIQCSAMNNEREILYDSVAAIINIQPTNEMFVGIMTSRDNSGEVMVVLNK